MADEVFALSPISARAAQPNEEDYAAIHQAFMETSRGRWFLGEYAKRNRNADTHMVLDAVARIEGSLAAQKQVAVDAGLTAALAAIRTTLEEAQAAANSGLEGLASEEALAPINRAVRIIREISWRWRETGADGRICDILDSQIAAIEASAGQLSSADARAAVDGAFAAIEARIDDLWPGESAPVRARRPDQDANVVPFPAPAEEVSVQAATSPASAAPTAEAPVGEFAEPAAAEATASAAAYAPEPEVEQRIAEQPIADSVEAIEYVDEAADDAHDEAMLDLIAAEMSAPQPMDDEIALAEAAIAESELVEAELTDPELFETGVDMTETVAVAVVQPPPPAAATPAPKPTQVSEVEASVGQAVIASGILAKPKARANDALAPIRRMSQAEKIAFFS